MKFLYSLTGANVPVIKEFDINNTEKINEGDVLYLDLSGKVTTNASANIIGVSAETHTGTKDVLNERNNKDKLRVDITAFGVYEVPPMTLTATAEGTTNTFVCSEEGLNSILANGKLVLIEKAEGSTNTDNLGDMRTVISNTNEGGNCIMTVDAGGIACKGDVYAFYPAPGTLGALHENGKDFAVSSPVPIPLLVVGRDFVKGKLEIMFKNTVFKN